MTINALSYLLESYISDALVSVNDDISDIQVCESYLIHGSPYLYALEGNVVDKVTGDIKKIIEVVKEKVKNLGSTIKSIIKKVMSVFALIFDSVTGRTRTAYNKTLVKNQCKYIEECSAKIVKGFALEATLENMLNGYDYDTAVEASSNTTGSSYSLIPTLYPRFSEKSSSIISNIDGKIKSTIDKSQLVRDVRSNISYTSFVDNKARISAIKSLKSNKKKKMNDDINGNYSEIGRRLGNSVGFQINKLTNDFRAKMSAKRVEKALSRPTPSFRAGETVAKYWWNNDMITDEDKMSKTLSELEDKNEKNIANILKSIEGRSEYCKKVLDSMKEKYGVEYPLSAVLDPNGNGTMSNMTIAEASSMYHKTFAKCSKYIMSHYNDLRAKTVRLEGSFTHKLLDEIKTLFIMCGSLLGIFISMMGLLKSSRGLTINER